MKDRNKRNAYAKIYYKKNKDSILQKAKERYFSTRVKPKCKKCGLELPTGASGHTRYCDRCLNSKGHGPEAHRLAAVRWYRKNKAKIKKHLTK